MKPVNNFFNTGISRMGFIHIQWDFKWTISCVWCWHLVCIEL